MKYRVVYRKVGESPDDFVARANGRIVTSIGSTTLVIQDWNDNDAEIVLTWLASDPRRWIKRDSDQTYCLVQGGVEFRWVGCENNTPILSDKDRQALSL